MVSEMKRMSVVVLLSIALASGKAEAKVNSNNKLSGMLDSLSNQARKFFQSDKTMCVSMVATGMCIGGGVIMELLGFSEAAMIAMHLSFPSFMFLFGTIFGNQERRHHEAVKAIGEAWHNGLNRNTFHYKNNLYLAEDVVVDPGPVEVNDFDSLYGSMFDRIYTIDPSQRDQAIIEKKLSGLEHSPNPEALIQEIFDLLYPPNPEALAQAIQRLDTLVEENGGFPLTVERDGLTFNSLVFTSYTDLFGDGNFRHRTQKDTYTEDTNMLEEVSAMVDIRNHTQGNTPAEANAANN